MFNITDRQARTDLSRPAKLKLITEDETARPSGYKMYPEVIIKNDKEKLVREKGKGFALCQAVVYGPIMKSFCLMSVEITKEGNDSGNDLVTITACYTKPLFDF